MRKPIERSPAPGWLERITRLRGIMACGVIVLAALLAYHNSFKVPFVFDDEASILKNPTILRLWPLGPVFAPPGQGETVSGRPLLNLSFAVNHALGGFNVAGYHVVNFSLHVWAGMLLFGILHRTMAARARAGPSQGSRSSAPGVFIISLASATIWTVHPLQTESVTYIVQRAESLMGLFYLLTLYCFIRGAESDDRSQAGIRSTEATPLKARIFYALAVFTCALGMATKEVMATAPLLVLLYDYTYLAGDLRQAWRRRWPVYTSLALTWIVLAYLVLSAGGRGGSAGFGTGIKWSDYLLYQFEAVATYLRLAFWPHPLVFDYGQDLAVTGPGVALAAVVLGGIGVATLYGLWRRASFGFLGAAFFIILAPSSSIIPILAQTMAEHRMYLSLAPVIVVTVTILHRMLRDRSWLLFAALTGILIVLTFQRNQVYRNPQALWSDTVAKVPKNAGAQNNLGLALLAAGDVSAAIGRFEHALQLNPGYLGAKSNLGSALLRAGKPKEAVDCFEAVLKIHPDATEVRQLLGFALIRDHRPGEAVVQLDQVVQAEPDNTEARRVLGRAYLEAGRESEALKEYERVVRSLPHDPEVQASLADLLLQAGRAGEAIPHYREVIRLAPDFAGSRINFGNALLQTGRPLEALNAYDAALRLQPKNPMAVRNRAVALRALGRNEEAMREFERADRLNDR